MPKSKGDDNMKMIVSGKSVNVQMADIPADKLDPNYDQPRRYELEKELESKGLDTSVVKKPEGIELSTRFDQLVGSIIENKGISLPLVVERTDDKYSIIDGDRRFGAVMRILNDVKVLEENPGLKDQLATLPCLVVEGPLSEEERLRLLAHIHVHLVPWRPIAKEKVVLDLQERVGDERTTRIMGFAPSKIKETLEVRELAKEFSFKGPKAVSWARELRNIKKSLMDEEVKKATVQKVKDGRITSSVKLRDLRPILEDPDARAVYIKPESSIEDAEKVLKAKELKATIAGPDIEFNDLLDRLATSLKSIRFEELTKYKGSKTIKKTVDECIALLSSFKSYL